MFSKPNTFGQATTSQFGGFSSPGQAPQAGTSSPFGQNAFNKPVASTPGFPAPAFGTGSTMFGGGTTASSPGLFGNTAAPAFGQQPQQTTAGFSGFNAGTSAPLFGGTTGVSSFAQPKPAFGGFGTTTSTSSSLFGAQQPTVSMASAGQPGGSMFNQGMNLFSSGFGGTGAAGGAATLGTPIKFNAPTGTDSMAKNGLTQTINTRHQCITCMKEYENKSLEELRLEDLQAGRKGPTGGDGLFGAVGAAQPQQNTLFGTTGLAQPGASGTGFGDNKTLFGSTAPTSTGLGGFGTTTSGFGATNQVTGGGLFGKPTGFGATTTTSASGFSFNNNPTTANPFGAAAQNKPFGAAAPGSMFGGQQTTGNVFGAQNTTGFGTAGFGAQQQQQGIGLFGQKQAVTPFGMTAQQPATSTAFSFGQNTVNTAQGGGLFGAKPQLTTMGTSFGGNTLFGAKPAGTAATPNFGSTPFGAPTNTGLAGASNNLFGQSTFGKPGAQGFGFGQTQPGAAVPNQGLGTGGMFGSTLGKPATAGGMFGGSGGGLFGTSTSTATPGFGLGTSNAFGTTGLTSGGLTLGQTPNLGFNTNKPPMFSTGFGNAFGGQQNTMSSQDAHQRITALVANPFDRPIFNGLPTDKLEKMMAPTNPSVLKTVLNQSPSFSISSATSKPRLLVSPKTLTPSKKSLFEGLEPTSSAPKLLLGNSVYNTPSFDHKRLNLRPSRAETPSNRESLEPFDTNNNDSPVSVAEPSTSSPILTLKEKLIAAAASTSQDKVTETPCSSASEKNKNQEFTTPLMGDLQHARRLALDELHQSPLSDSNVSASSIDLTVPEESDDCPPHPAGIKLKRSGYFTIPSLLELAEVTDNNGQCIVDSFTIGRENYGNIYFEGPLDVSGLDLDDLVHIRHREVMVYPNDDKKHPEGQGLNRKAIVTLDNIYPTDKTTREPITSAEALREMDYEAFLRRKCSKMDSHFVEYRPETGSFVFKVSHFSKYEVSEESEAEELQAQAGAKKVWTDLKQVTGVPLQQQKAPSSQQTSAQKTPAQQLLPSQSHFLSTPPAASSHVHHTLQGPVSDYESMDEGVVDAQSPTDQLSRHAGIDPCKMRLMKASLFAMDEPETEMHTSMSQDFTHGSLVTMLDTPPPSVGRPAQYDTEMFIEEEEEKKETRPRRAKQHPKLVTPSYHMMPAKVTLQHTACYADAALYFSRSFKSSWGSNSTLLMSEDLSIHLTTPYEQSDNFMNWVKRHLNVQLRHSGIVNEGSIVPRRCIQPGLAPLEEHCQVISQVQEQDARERLIKQVLQLCLALWGPLVALPDDAQPSLIAHRRKEALGDWLQSVIEDQEQEENEDPSKLTKLQNVLQHLTRGRLLDGVFESQKQGEHYSALVMATAGSSTSTRQLMQRQLQEWVSDEVSCLIDPTRLKIWLMAGAGLPLLTMEDGDTLNALEGLDWITCLAVHYWYLCSPGASIPDVLIRYEQAFTGENCFATAPIPSGGSEENLDIRFHLLKLFSQRTYCLEKLLKVETHFPETPLDTSLSWLVLVLLDSLQYTHVEGYCSQSIHLAFSEQLEAAGLWHLAIFVLQHISDPVMRDSAVEQMVGRHVTIESLDFAAPNELSPREDYIVNQLDIPSTMVYRAKSYLAACRQMHEQTACYQLLAGDWAACHRTLVDHLAADAVINDKYDQVLRLLKSLHHHCQVIDGWEEQGQVFLTYLSLLEEVRSWKLAGEETGFGMSSTGNLEALYQRVYSLINQAAKLPVKMPRDRLCQCEIARRSVAVARLMISSAARGGSTSKFSGIVETLPLPDDYRLQELQQAAKQITEEFK